MTFLWCLTAIAAALAGAALVTARQSARQYARLAESYLELRYEYRQLAARLERAEARLDGRPLDDEVTPVGHGTTAFVPLASLKR